MSGGIKAMLRWLSATSRLRAHVLFVVMQCANGGGRLPCDKAGSENKPVT